MNEFKVSGRVTGLNDKVVGDNFFIGEVTVHNIEENGGRAFENFPTLQFQGNKGQETYNKIQIGQDVTLTGSLKCKEGGKFTNVVAWKLEASANTSYAGQDTPQPTPPVNNASYQQSQPGYGAPQTGQLPQYPPANPPYQAPPVHDGYNRPNPPYGA